MRILLLLMTAFVATSCGADDRPDTSTPASLVTVSQPGVVPPPPSTVPPPIAAPVPRRLDTSNLALDASRWSAGPIINGTNFSLGTMITREPNGFAVNIPYPTQDAGTSNYITLDYGSLAGATAMVLEFRVEAPEGTVFHPRNRPGFPPLVTLYFQREGDDWSAGPLTESYRWWASPKSVLGLVPGRTYLVRHRFDERWTAVLHSSSNENPSAFRDAMERASKIGFTLGGGDGAGHGFYATAPAKLVVTNFRIEQ